MASPIFTWKKRIYSGGLFLLFFRVKVGQHIASLHDVSKLKIVINLNKNKMLGISLWLTLRSRPNPHWMWHWLNSLSSCPRAEHGKAGKVFPFARSLLELRINYLKGKCFPWTLSGNGPDSLRLDNLRMRAFLKWLWKLQKLHP